MDASRDLFGQPSGPDQLSLFGEGEGRMAPPRQDFSPKPEVVRARLHALLARARSAQALPWPEREARMWNVVFPQMANWLPEEEADQLRFDFAREMERLKAA